jgi:hypothetical protein
VGHLVAPGLDHGPPDLPDVAVGGMDMLAAAPGAHPDRYGIPRGLRSGDLPPSQPSPSSARNTAASLSTACTLGFDDSGAFEANTAANWKTYYSYTAEEVTLTNVSKVGRDAEWF